MTSPMTREQEIQTECLLQMEGGPLSDPNFYSVKMALRSELSTHEGHAPPMIEILPNKITVIDHDMTVHTI